MVSCRRTFARVSGAVSRLFPQRVLQQQQQQHLPCARKRSETQMSKKMGRGIFLEPSFSVRKCVKRCPISVKQHCTMVSRVPQRVVPIQKYILTPTKGHSCYSFVIENTLDMFKGVTKEVLVDLDFYIVMGYL